MLRFVLGFAVGWVTKRWLDDEIAKNRVFYGDLDYSYADALRDKYEEIKGKFSSLDSESSIKGDRK